MVGQREQQQLDVFMCTIEVMNTDLIAVVYLLFAEASRNAPYPWNPPSCRPTGAPNLDSLRITIPPPPVGAGDGHFLQALFDDSNFSFPGLRNLVFDETFGNITLMSFLRRHPTIVSLAYRGIQTSLALADGIRDASLLTNLVEFRGNAYCAGVVTGILPSQILKLFLNSPPSTILHNDMGCLALQCCRGLQKLHLSAAGGFSDADVQLISDYVPYITVLDIVYNSATAASVDPSSFYSTIFICFPLLVHVTVRLTVPGTPQITRAHRASVLQSPDLRSIYRLGVASSKLLPIAVRYLYLDVGPTSLPTLAAFQSLTEWMSSVHPASFVRTVTLFAEPGSNRFLSHFKRAMANIVVETNRRALKSFSFRSNSSSLASLCGENPPMFSVSKLALACPDRFASEEEEYADWLLWCTGVTTAVKLSWMSWRVPVVSAKIAQTLTGLCARCTNLTFLELSVPHTDRISDLALFQHALDNPKVRFPSLRFYFRLFDALNTTQTLRRLRLDKLGGYGVEDIRTLSKALPNLEDLCVRPLLRTCEESMLFDNDLHDFYSATVLGLRAANSLVFILKCTRHDSFVLSTHRQHLEAAMRTSDGPHRLTVALCCDSKGSVWWAKEFGSSVER
ncbi:hypothetical protein GG344DRAFT_83771 [Lentinula edodes]|nr:hypothetical protein GG344DRAFT_83771 [Lentinula edodes]